MWDPFRPVIAGWGFEVLTYDLPGHGSAAAETQPHNLELYAQQLLAGMDAKGWARAHLVGFSLGGMINRKVALIAPERAASLVVWNSPHDRGPTQQATVEDRAKAAREQGVEATLDAALARWLTADASLALRAQIRAWRQACDPDSYADAAWVLAHGVRELIGARPKHPVPGQVVTCEHDVGSTPAMAYHIAKDLSYDAAPLEPILIPGLKHLGLLQRPQVFLASLKIFLAAAARQN